MRRLTFGIVLVVAAVSVLALSAAATTDASAVEGVWKYVSITYTTPEGTQEIDITQPSFLIFTAKHYASLFVTGGEPRAELPEGATDEQLVAAWRPFIAHAGTYEVKGNEIHQKMLLNKSPKQSDGTPGTFEVDGDTLVRTGTPAPGVTVVVKCVRVE